MNNKEIMEKISELEQQIAELKEAAQKQDEPKAWNPKAGEDYWYISESMSATNADFCEDDFDNRVIKSNNCFPTKERAEKAAKKIRMLLKLERYHDMFCPDYVPDYKGDETKYHLYFSHVQGKYEVSCSTGIESPCMAVFDTEENAEKAAEILNKEMRKSK